MMVGRFAPLAALLLAPPGSMVGAAFAQAVPATAIAVPVSTAAPTSPLAGMLQGLVGLVIVVGLIYAAAWLLKKVGPRNRSSGLVHVVGGASVGPRERVVVVRYGHETLLLGVAPGSVTLLHAAETVEAGDAAPVDAGAVKPRFADRLRVARETR